MNKFNPPFLIMQQLSKSDTSAAPPFAKQLFFKESKPILGSASTPSLTQSTPDTTKTITNNTPPDGQPVPTVQLFNKAQLQLHHNVITSVSSGLNNVGNSCYCNSALQALFSVPPLANLFRNRTHSNTCQLRECYLCILNEIFNQMYSGSRSISPVGIIKRLTKISSGFTPFRQADAHEFLCKLLEKVETSLLSPYASQSLDYASKHTTLLHQIMGGWSRSEIQCPKCAYSSKTYTLDMSTPLEIVSGVDSIESALYKYTCTETLGYGNEWKCDGCKQKVLARKRMSFNQPPLTLTLQLKRFMYTSKGRAKINKHIAFTPVLNLGPYMTSKPLVPVTYKLQAVIVHAGSTHGGHYYSYIKACNGVWFEMNDASVRQVALQSVLQSNAYILMYTADHMDMTRVAETSARAVSVQTANPHSQSFMDIVQTPTPPSSSPVLESNTFDQKKQQGPSLVVELPVCPMSHKQMRKLRRKAARQKAASDGLITDLGNLSCLSSGQLDCLSTPPNLSIPSPIIKPAPPASSTNDSNIAKAPTPTPVTSDNDSPKSTLKSSKNQNFHKQDKFVDPRALVTTPAASDNDESSTNDVKHPTIDCQQSDVPTPVQTLLPSMQKKVLKPKKRTLLRFNDRQTVEKENQMDGWEVDASMLETKYAKTYLEQEMATKEKQRIKKRRPDVYDMDYDRGKLAKKGKVSASQVLLTSGGHRNKLQHVSAMVQQGNFPSDPVQEDGSLVSRQDEWRRKKDRLRDALMDMKRVKKIRRNFNAKKRIF